MRSASLAIMAKIEQLYDEVVADDDTFLSFIPIALPFDADALSRAGGDAAGSDAAEELAAAADFSVLANYIPPVSEIWSQDGRLLWDVYQRVLNDARLAAPALSEGEARRLEEATSLLVDSVTGEPTETYVRYGEFQARYLQARERHAAALLTAENSTDPAVISEWEAKEEQLRSEVESALAQWRAMGSKDAVDEALAVQAHLGALDPVVRFAKARDRLEQAKRSGLATGTGTFFETSYLPRGMFAPHTVWTKVELHASEIAALTEPADDEDTELDDLADAAEDFEIRRLSVEIGRANVLRDWFDTDLLTSRSWRWRSDAPPLSDGGDPPQGSLPAYVTAMLFVRNLEVELEPGSAKNESLVAELQVGRPMLIGNIVLQQVASTVDSSAVTKLTSARGGLHSHSVAALTARMSASLPGPTSQPTPPAEGARLLGRRALPATALSARMSVAAPVATATARTGRPRVRDHRASSDTRRPAPGTGRRPAVRDHRDRPTPRRPRVRDHRTGFGRPRIEDIVGRDRVVVRVPTERSRSTLSGDVEDGRSGEPVEGARVTLEAEGKPVRSVVTDGSGRYRVIVPAGSYQLSVTSEGFQEFEASGPVTVGRGASVDFDVQLVPAGPVTQTQPGIQLIAVLCRELPTAPDPDPELDWS